MPISPKRKMIQQRLMLLAIVAAIGAGIWFWWASGKESTDDAEIEAHVVPIAAKIPGYIDSVNVEDNQQVKAGDVLVTIRPKDYQIRVDTAKAGLAEAEAKLAEATHSLKSTKVSAPSQVDSAKSEVSAAKANWEKAAEDLKRYRSMSDQAVSRQQLDSAVAAEASARSALENAKAKLRSAETAPYTVASAESGVQELEAAVDKAQADLDEAENDLFHTSLTAPFDGHVAEKSVEKGAYVQPGQELLAVVSDDYWVVANFKENQLAHMKPGQAALIRIDAYPGKTYKGHVDSIQTGTGARFSAFPAENATGNYVKVVQRVPVKIVFDERPDPLLPIGPGMSVEPTVIIK